MDEDISKKFSPSKLGTYENCPRQYKFRYIDRLRRDTTSVEAFVGTCVHTALEKLYLGFSHGRLMSEEEAAAVFDAAWDEGFSEKVLLGRGDWTAEEWRRAGRDCVRAYHRAHRPFDEDKTVAVERRVGFPLTVDDPASGTRETYRIEGYVDRLALAPDGAFEIHDYKTSGTLPTQADKDEDRQLAIYEIAVREAWPDAAAVRLKWHFLRHGKTIVSTRTPEQLAALRRDIAALIGTIKRDHAFEPRKSALCDWCEYRDICPLWKHVAAYEKLPPEERRHESGVQLADAYAELQSRKKRLREEISVLETEEEDLERRIVGYAEAHDARVLAGTDSDVSIQARDEYRFPSRAHEPEKLEAIEARLKATTVWPLVSRLDTRTLIDGFKARRWPVEIIEIIDSWVDKLIRHETVRSVRLRRKKENDDD